MAQSCNAWQKQRYGIALNNQAQQSNGTAGNGGTFQSKGMDQNRDDKKGYGNALFRNDLLGTEMA